MTEAGTGSGAAGQVPGELLPDLDLEIFMSDPLGPADDAPCPEPAGRWWA